MTLKTVTKRCECGKPARGEGIWADVCVQWPICVSDTPSPKVVRS